MIKDMSAITPEYMKHRLEELLENDRKIIEENYREIEKLKTLWEADRQNWACIMYEKEKEIDKLKNNKPDLTNFIKLETAKLNRKREQEKNRLYRENLLLKNDVERLNNIIKQQDTRNSRQRVANKELQDRFNSLMEAHKICDEENFRLDNIINELLMWLEEQADKNDDSTIVSKSYKLALYNIVDKIKELKGSDKE